MNLTFTFPALLMTAVVITCKPPLSNQPGTNDSKVPNCRIMFYNIENFFDTVDDSVTRDEDFTPSGRLHWTYTRYATKLRNTYKVIIAVGLWKPPDIVGLCEIENREVLNDLTRDTPLAKYSYRFIHEDSPDQRGIDVAMLYNPKTVRILSHKSHRIHGVITRDILYCKALLGGDTCHFLVNHWPSRSENQLVTDRNRFLAAGRLKHITDSLLFHYPSAKIVIMGDFNDEPSDESLVRYLCAEPAIPNPRKDGLYNLTVTPSSGAVKGTLKYQGKWNVFDQMIVSGSLLSAKRGLIADAEQCRIFMKTYLLTEDPTYEGYKPFRTYNGFKYQGGFSDHLPVYMDLLVR